MKRLTGILLSSALVLSLTACSGSAPDETSATAAETTTAAQTEATAAETEVAGIPDGTYEGEGTGKGGTIKVELTIKDSEITDIKVLEHQELRGTQTLWTSFVRP